MRTTFTFHTAGQLLFGRYAVRQLPEQLARLNVVRMLIVTDVHLERAGILAAVREPLAAAGVAVEIFAGGEPEPSIDLADSVIAQARATKPDAILGLGGGSNMDLAKIAAAVVTHGGAIRDYLGEDKLPGPVLPLVCIPTTSGTGSEVSAASVLTDKANHVKVGILSNYLRPRLALVDPELTLSCPRKVTADSGIDALTHAIEAFTAVDNAEFPLPAGERSTYQGRHPFGDMLAERSIALVGKYLVRCCDAPQDYEAREGMALAAVLGGMAFSNVGVAIVHALEYPIGAVLHCSHGAGNGLLLPYVMRYNMPARRPAFARIAQLLGANTAGLDETAAAEAAITAVEKLRAADRHSESPARHRSRSPTNSPGSPKRRLRSSVVLRVNPRVPTLEDMRGVLEAAY
ncbi:MAG: iron-containing alcohol dehydrogenase [Pirellulales bacterium]